MPAHTGPTSVVAASVTGQKHLRQQQLNQDSYCVSSRPDGVLCLVVADGAGSARCAQKGSSLAVHIATNIIAEATLPTCESAWEDLLVDWLEQVHSQMQTWLHEQQHAKPTYSLQDLSTTLLITVVTDRQVAAVQVGDGGIIALTKDAGQEDEVDFVTQPYHGEYVGETVFVTSTNYLDYASTKVLARADLCCLAMMTDGLEPVAIQQQAGNLAQQGQPFAAFFEPLFKFVASPAHNLATKSQQLAEFLASERMCARSDDDKTLVLTRWEP